MSVLVISLVLATACINDECFNVLVGKNNLTPVGEYSTYYAKTNQFGYDGEVIVFKETNTVAFSIHKPFKSLNNPYYREKVIQSNNPQDRKISNGCINIPSDMFDKYKHSIEKVIILDK